MAAEKVGEFPASGIFFKDSVQTLAIDDPEVQGVTIYISGKHTNFRLKISTYPGEVLFPKIEESFIYDISMPNCDHTGLYTIGARSRNP
jgi:hypothetical protein